MTASAPESGLLFLKEQLDAREQCHLSPAAALSKDALRRQEDDKTGHRQAYGLDADRILHSRAYTRYIDKTQVFSLVANDHITHRVLHVQLVSKIGRTIGRFLGLNEDLIEAIALGHDIGHAPFGHDGERMLDELCHTHGLEGFQHNIQSVRFLERIERHGAGWNLSLQTLDGILCHDGEIHNRALRPDRQTTFDEFDRKLALKAADPAVNLAPMTLEGCVVRLADTISYIGRDIEDAIELGLVSRNEIPADCGEVLGRTNGTIVYRLVADLIANGTMGDRLSFSPAVSESLRRLKQFNYQRIYLNPEIKRGLTEVQTCYRRLFGVYLDDLERLRRDSAIWTDFLTRMEPVYLESHRPAAMVRDFIAGMTDTYFLAQAARCGCTIPLKP